MGHVLGTAICAAVRACSISNLQGLLLWQLMPAAAATKASLSCHGPHKILQRSAPAARRSQEVSEGQGKFRFTLQFGGKGGECWKLAADSQEERKEWLNAAIHYFMVLHGSPRPSQTTGGGSGATTARSASFASVGPNDHPSTSGAVTPPGLATPGGGSTLRRSPLPSSGTLNLVGGSVVNGGVSPGGTSARASVDGRASVTVSHTRLAFL